MKGFWLFISGVVCGAAVSAIPKAVTHLHETAAQTEGSVHALTDAARAHTEERFVFTAHAPMEEVAPLFGANKERDWSPHWNPQFIYPSPAVDREGMVVTVKHGQRRSIWVNTDFDVKGGRVRYVYVIPDALATVITVRLGAEGNRTRVEVEYDRTALSAETEPYVRQMAEQDHKAGPDWEVQVNAYLGKHNNSRNR